MQESNATTVISRWRVHDSEGHDADGLCYICLEKYIDSTGASETDIPIHRGVVYSLNIISRHCGELSQADVLPHVI